MRETASNNGDGAGIAVIISTHTARHLRLVLLGVAVQQPSPRWVAVSCDTDDAAVLKCAAECSAEFEIDLVVVLRTHTGRSRSSQVRNNGVRMLATGPAGSDVPADDARLVFLDGDICLLRGALLRHAELGGPDGARGRLVLGFRVELSEAQTGAFEERALRRGEPPVTVTAEQQQLLTQRHARYVRQAWLRRVGLAKPHKPKVLSANFSLPLGWFSRVNGFDEEYEGYGQEDDDLGRRLYRAGCRPAIGIAAIPALHLHHPTRAPAAWEKSPNADRFAGGARAAAVWCARGLASPMAQPELSVYQITKGRVTRIGSAANESQQAREQSAQRTAAGWG